MRQMEEGCGVGRAMVHGKLVGPHMVVLHFDRRGVEPWHAVKLAFQLLFLAAYCWWKRATTSV